jgi:hypothetical protein
MEEVCYIGTLYLNKNIRLIYILVENLTKLRLKKSLRWVFSNKFLVIDSHMHAAMPWIGWIHTWTIE